MPPLTTRVRIGRGKLEGLSTLTRPSQEHTTMSGAAIGKRPTPQDAESYGAGKSSAGETDALNAEEQ